jgi:hypothetical protein
MFVFLLVYVLENCAEFCIVHMYIVIYFVRMYCASLKNYVFSCYCIVTLYYVQYILRLKHPIHSQWILESGRWGKKAT